MDGSFRRGKGLCLPAEVFSNHEHLKQQGGQAVAANMEVEFRSEDSEAIHRLDVARGKSMKKEEEPA